MDLYGQLAIESVPYVSQKKLGEKAIYMSAAIGYELITL